MPIFYKKIEGSISNGIIGNILFIKNVYGDIQREDFINLNGFIAYTQNFSKIDYTAKLIQPLNFGLINANNIPIVTINIDY